MEQEGANIERLQGSVATPMEELSARVDQFGLNENDFEINYGTEDVPITQASVGVISYVGRFLTDAPVNFLNMKQEIASYWRPVMGVTIKELHDPIPGSRRETRFLFELYDEVDATRVVQEGPWTYKGHVLILHRLTLDDNPFTVALWNINVWIQAKGIPKRFASDKICQDLGNAIGRFVEADSLNYRGGWGQYDRFRIEFDM